MNKEVTLQDCHHLNPLKRISWTAIFVGTLIGVGLSFLLGLFGLAIGLSVVNSNAGTESLAVGGFLGTVISTIAAMLVAGYAAGYLGRLYCPQRNLGIVYGFATWSLALLVSAIIATHLTTYVTAYAEAISHSAFVVHQTSKAIHTTLGKLPWGAFCVFILFFIGALATCFGACWGMACERED